MKKYLANIITCTNLFSGCIGTMLAFQGKIIQAAYTIFFATTCDLLDGIAARLYHTQNKIGKDLDSLADVISFGLLPAAILYQLLLQAPKIAYLGQLINYTPFIMTIFSALRLARFNTDPRQKENFIGLPTPANALLVASLPLILAQNEYLVSKYLLHPLCLVSLVVIMSILLVAELPLINLRFKNSTIKDNIYRYLLIIFTITFVTILKFASIPAIIFIYIALSVIQFRLRNKSCS